MSLTMLFRVAMKLIPHVSEIAAERLRRSQRGDDQTRY
jgi:hypothetical protein